VKVGKVKQIDFVRNLYKSQLSPEDLLRYGRYVVVRVSVLNAFPGLPYDEISSALKEQIYEGLRVRLATQGLTGVVHLEVDHLNPKDYPPIPIAWQPAALYVPSAPSTITVVGNALNNIAKDLEQANIHKATEDLDKLLVSVTKLIEDTQMEQLSRQAGQTLTDLQSTIKETRRLLDSPEIRSVLSDTAAAAGGARRMVTDLTQTAKKINQVSDTLPETIVRFEKSLRRMDRLIASKSQDLEQTIDNLRKISENLRDLTNDAKRHPSQLVFGEPPPRRERTEKP
jgi:hypothetical protein